MTRTNKKATSKQEELLIIAPADPRRAVMLATRMTDLGVFFQFEPPAKLPELLPADLRGYRLILIPKEKAAGEEQRLAAFTRRGGDVHYMEEAQWDNESFIERVPTRGGLTLGHPAMVARLETAPDQEVFEATLAWSMVYMYPEWHDVLRYNIECLVEAHDLTGDRAILDQAGRLVDLALQAPPPEPLQTCDHVSCTYAILQYMRRANRPELLKPCRELVDSYVRLAPRYRGVLSNLIKESGILRAEIAFQGCPGFARLARCTGERRYADLAVEQLLILKRELEDRKTGLWYLGRGPGGRTPVLWGRGCAFSFRGIVDTFEELEPAHPGRKKLAAMVTRMASSLKALQGADGDWRQIVDEPDSRPESSTTAWSVVGLAKAIRLGLLPDAEYRRCIEKGWRAAKRRIWGGMSTRLCGGVTASMDPEYYRSRHFMKGSYGHFHLLAAIEVLRRRAAQRANS
jgi:rhamnogalacturonyl hydrolase YesR